LPVLTKKVNYTYTTERAYTLGMDWRINGGLRKGEGRGRMYGRELLGREKLVFWDIQEVRMSASVDVSSLLDQYLYCNTNTGQSLSN
jgi:hypothetical protein